MSEEKKVKFKDIVSNEKLDEMKRLTIEAVRIARVNGSTLPYYGSRGKFGTQYDGDRDLNDILGWEENPTYQTYHDQYKRGGIAQTIIDIKPQDTWRGDLSVTVPVKDGEKQSETEKEFEEKWLRIWKKNRMQQYFRRADVLAGIGEYAVLRLGFAEPKGTNFKKPVRKAKKLIYAAVFGQDHAEIKEIDYDELSENYGMPLYYGITTEQTDSSLGSRPTGGGNTRTFERVVRDEQGNLKGVSNPQQSQNPSGTEMEVHYSRCILVNEPLEDDIYGPPRLEGCLNHLYDLVKVSGGSSEMYWRGAFPGFAFDIDPEAEFTPDDATNMSAEIDNYMLTMKRYIRTQGVNVKSLAPQVVSPKDQISALLDLIAGTTRIPKRILIGSERGELASSQDEDNWTKVIQSRRENDCTNWVRQYTDMLMEYGILPQVEDYVVNWPPLKSEKELEKSEIALNRAKAMKEYVEGALIDLIGVKNFFVQVLGMSDEIASDLASEVDEARLKERGEEGIPEAVGGFGDDIEVDEEVDGDEGEEEEIEL